MSVKVTVEDNFDQAEKCVLTFLKASDIAELSAASLKTFVAAGGTLFHQRDVHMSIGVGRSLKELDQQEREAQQEEERDNVHSYFEYLRELREYGYDSD